jgi:hypothetical protein
MDMKVRATPSFFAWRNGTEVHSQKGIASGALPRALVGLLQPGEAGADWQPPPQPEVLNSDDE